MEIVQSIFIWIVIGVWICYKRNWYKNYNHTNDTPNFLCGVTIILAPISLIIAFFDVFIEKSWEKK